MSIGKKHIESEVARIIEDLGYFFIEMVIRGDNRKQVYEVYVDSKEGITTEDCADISRNIHEFFDQFEDEMTDYRLDVSSPGVERPLKYIQQFYKHIDRDFQIKYEANGETKKQKGKLLNVSENNLLFQFGKEEVQVPFENVKEAKVQISF